MMSYHSQFLVSVDSTVDLELKKRILCDMLNMHPKFFVTKDYSALYYGKKVRSTLVIIDYVEVSKTLSLISFRGKGIDRNEYKNFSNDVVGCLQKLTAKAKIIKVGDDLSKSYSVECYQHVYDVENFLRKFIHIFMLEKAGYNWMDNFLPQSVNGEYKNHEEFLHLAFFNDLIEILFTTFRDVSVRTNEDVKKFIKQLTKNKLMSIPASELDIFLELSNLERFANINSSSQLKVRKELENFKQYRNDIAHNVYVSFETYKRIVSAKDRIVKYFMELSAQMNIKGFHDYRSTSMITSSDINETLKHEIVDILLDHLPGCKVIENDILDYFGTDGICRYGIKTEMNLNVECMKKLIRDSELFLAKYQDCDEILLFVLGQSISESRTVWERYFIREARLKVKFSIVLTDYYETIEIY
ncbi:hypothetical protein GGR28_003481 [Lewinella aquimaris]|uniref:Apea-like HEPN domain-containing protein n=1 Tax=Neolewinella aquimaris TaxID=1835722 RepID=A0A840EAV4_9BACT|nr:hypothetical protein [Neolewinella aquimaris]MBB4080842.1 hypothetical protein [Neolewinella aquimaris]